MPRIWRHRQPPLGISLGSTFYQKCRPRHFWYYRARLGRGGPVEALKRKIRSDQGQHPSVTPSNRWHSSKSLREKWLAHIEAALYRPVLIIDEAQETHSLVLSELRLLASADLDSRSILTIVLAGDQRLEALSPKTLQECLQHLLKAAGNPKLLTPSLIQTLCEHATGNLRLLMNMANDLLAAASHQEREVLDEKLFFEVFSLDPRPAKKP